MRVDARHTEVGYATHHAATVFWALLFEAWREASPGAFKARMVTAALAVSAIAAAVDYGATPRRFTRGRELVLSKRAIAVAYAAMALGMAAAAPLARPRA